MNWCVIEADYSKETRVEHQIAMMGYATFVPVKVKDVAISRHTKARKLVYSILIPKLVFALAPADIYLRDVKHANKLLRNVRGEVFQIPDSQMVTFRLAHQAWLETQTKAYQAYLKSLQPKSKKIVIRPKDMGWQEALQELGNVLYGANEVIHPFQQMEVA